MKKAFLVFYTQCTTTLAAWYLLDAWLYMTDGYDENPALNVFLALCLLFSPYLFKWKVMSVSDQWVRIPK